MVAGGERLHAPFSKRFVIAAFYFRVDQYNLLKQKQTLAMFGSFVEKQSSTSFFVITSC